MSGIFSSVSLQVSPLLPINSAHSVDYSSSSCVYYDPQNVKFRSHSRLQSSRHGFQGWETLQKISFSSKANLHNAEEQNGIPYVQTLGKFPREELYGKVVMVRINLSLPIVEVLDFNDSSIGRYILTIKYLYHAGAKVLIASSWGGRKDMIQPSSAQTVADRLSSVLQLRVMATIWVSACTRSKEANLNKADILLTENLSKFKEELANCSEFARKLSSGVDIFVNETFSQSHKILASTVAIPRYCYASVAGFGFEEELSQIAGIARTTKQPYLAIIGGDNLNEKADAVQFLASKCDGLIFVGMMAFQIMHAKGLTVPLRFVDLGAVKNSLKIVDYAHKRNMLVLLPNDFLCLNENLPKKLHNFPAHSVLDGWEPVDLGPSSVTEISNVLSTCKKILSIGPLKFRLPRADSHVTSKLAVMLETASGNGCDVIVVGCAACKEFGRTSSCTFYENASVAWEFLRGSVLPGLKALDRAYPFEVDWKKVFDDPTQSLVVDIGSGNGLFLSEMARRQHDLNYLGLEMNKKLVNICLNLVLRSGPRNRHFIATNATSTFRSIISSYPGKVVLVSIQCPNPDFNKPDHRWRMLQRSLVEAIVDLLSPTGKVFLQSDVESVAARMRDEFFKYGKNKVAITDPHDRNGDWLKENPYGVQSDWERHVTRRGAPMYRLMFSKVDPRCR